MSCAAASLAGDAFSGRSCAYDGAMISCLVISSSEDGRVHSISAPRAAGAGLPAVRTRSNTRGHVTRRAPSRHAILAASGATPGEPAERPARFSTALHRRVWTVAPPSPHGCVKDRAFGGRHMTGATRRGGRNGIAEGRARPKAAQNTLNLARAAAHDLATFRTILDLQSESVSSLLDGQRMPPDVAEKLQRILRTARAASGTAAHFIQLARDAEATLRLALSGQLEPRRVLLLSCNARGETRAGCLLRLWDASWVTAAGGAS